MKKKLFVFLSIIIINCKIYSEVTEKHLVLPREFHVGQEFIFEGIPYIIKGYDQKKSTAYEKVKLILEHPIQFGIELGKETLILKIKYGKDEKNDIIYNTNLHTCIRSYNWKMYLLGYLLVSHFLPPVISIK